jgi:(2Fe-2S) ferredoxin
MALLLCREAQMPYYKHHVFMCTNLREDGRASCQDHGASEMRDYLKKKVKEAGLAGPKGVRINNSGCLDRCALGPVMAVYPNETWYRYKSREDLDEIFESHLKGDVKVQHLRISPKTDD